MRVFLSSVCLLCLSASWNNAGLAGFLHVAEIVQHKHYRKQYDIYMAVVEKNSIFLRDLYRWSMIPQ